MSEIKFRGMTYDRLCFIHFNLTSILESNEIPVDIDPITVERFTGFKDANDEDIYEGDIIRFYSPTNGVATIENVYPVSLFEGSYIVLKLNEESLTLREVIRQWGKYGNIEVIGNIYENPELLKHTPLQI